MQPDIPLLQQTILFSGIEAEELQHLLTCLGGSVRRYGRGEFLWHAGDTVLQAGIVLQGAVDAVQYRVKLRESIVAQTVLPLEQNPEQRHEISPPVTEEDCPA